jgi:MFS family permease
LLPTDRPWSEKRLTEEGRRYDRRGFWGIVLAQFLGAFNDNGLRWFLIAYSLRDVSPQEQGRVITWASFLFLCPYAIFSMHAGSLADRHSKRSVLIASKSAEAAIMALCAVALLFGGGPSFTLPVLLSTLCLLGVQATYYSPAKFGVLPEVLPERLLSWGNGIFEMTGASAGPSSSASSRGRFGSRPPSSSPPQSSVSRPRGWSLGVRR